MSMYWSRNPKVESSLATRAPQKRDRQPTMIPCSVREFCQEPVEVLEKALIEKSEVLVCADIDSDLWSEGDFRPRPVAVLVPIERYERYAEMEAQICELARLN